MTPATAILIAIPEAGGFCLAIRGLDIFAASRGLLYRSATRELGPAAQSEPVPASEPEKPAEVPARLATLTEGCSIAEVALRTGWSKSWLKDRCADGSLATVGRTRTGQWVIDRGAADALPVRGRVS